MQVLDNIEKIDQRIKEDLCVQDIVIEAQEKSNDIKQNVFDSELNSVKKALLVENESDTIAVQKTLMKSKKNKKRRIKKHATGL